MQQSRLAKLRDPVSATQPAGPDLSFDPEFEALAQEVEKMGRVDTGPPDWDAVEKGADRLLAERTRDMRLLVWSTAAKTQRRGWVGLAEGLAQYGEVVRTTWLVMHPPVARMRARSNLHDWLVEQVMVWLEERPIDVREAEGVRASDRLLAELDAELATQMGDAFGGSNRLRGHIRRLLPQLPAPIAPIAHAATADAGSPSTDAGNLAPALGAASVADRVRAAVDILLGTANAIIGSDPTDGRGYRLRRMGLALRAEEATTSPPPPAAATQAALTDLDQKQRFPELLKLAEEAVVESPMWLDAHRHAVEALTKLGPRYAEVREVVTKEVLSLFVRIPGVLSRRFSDGQPVANPRTQEWLESEMRRATTTLVVSSEDAELDRRFEEAKRLAAEGRASDAVSLAVGLANRAGDERGRFQGQLLAGKIAAEAGHPAVARPLLEGLLQAVERYQLEAWEPRMCVVLYGSLLACVKAQEGGDERGRELFDKLCKLDPAAAMRIGNA